MGTAGPTRGMGAKKRRAAGGSKNNEKQRRAAGTARMVRKEMPRCGARGCIKRCEMGYKELPRCLDKSGAQHRACTAGGGKSNAKQGAQERRAAWGKKAARGMGTAGPTRGMGAARAARGIIFLDF